MKSISLPVKETQRCAVLVVGGGVSGICAAIRAAREGANVILADCNFCLGGTATLGLVGPFMTCSDRTGTRQLIRGLYEEIVQRMMAKNGALHPMSCPAGSSYSGYYIGGHSNCGPFNAECLKLVAEEMCLEAGVTLRYGLTLIAVDCDGDRLQTAYFASKSGIYAIEASVFVDCTGDATLTALSGAPTQMSAPEDLQACSVFFEVDGIDKPVYDAYCKGKMTEQGDDHFDHVIAEERAAGRYSSERPRLGTYESADGTWRVNATRICGVDGTDANQVTDAMIRGRHQISDVVDLLRRRIPGCENIRLLDSASMLGIRESRRIVGEYELTVDDLAEGRVFADAIAECSNSVDFHSNTAGKYRVFTADSYTIPYRSLIPRGVANLLAAGRCISADRYAMSAIRVMPPCFAMGEAAGLGAAKAVQKHCDVRLALQD